MMIPQKPETQNQKALNIWEFLNTPVRLPQKGAHRLRIKKSLILKLSYIYIALPVFIFVAGWLRWYFAFPLLAALLFSVYFALVDSRESYGEEYVSIPITAAVSIAAILLLWAVVSGLGGLYYQTSDHNWRNAIFRDLINCRWPVVYQNGKTALIYYIAFWLPSAMVGKLFGWHAANIALLIWSFFGLCLVYLAIYAYLGIEKAKKAAAVLIILIFFSGLDFIGIAINFVLNGTGISGTLEWWNGVRQYSSVTTQLMWVYNQCIVPWLAIVVLLLQKNIKNMALILVLTLPFAPFPFLGMFPYALLALAVACVKLRKNPRELVRSVFTVQNIAPTLLILPVFFFYFKSNAQLGNGQSGSTGFMAPSLTRSGIFYLIAFFILEFLVYYIPIFYKNFKDPVFLLTGALLFAIPFFRVGTRYDFTMRASIPALFVLMLYVMRFITADGLFKRSRDTLISYILVVILTFGSITPFVEQWQALRAIDVSKKINPVADNIKTLSNKPKKGYENFLTENPYQTVFFKYFARK